MDVLTATQNLLEAFKDEYGINIEVDNNFKETPQRVVRSYKELLSGHIDTEKQISNILSKSFDSKYSGMVVCSNIKTFSMCPHHLLPVSYSVNVGYIPDKKVLGLSKLVRIADILARRLVLQEDYTNDIAEALSKLEPQGIIIQMYGNHTCLQNRGVKQFPAIITTSVLKGLFEELEVRNEFMMLIQNQRNKEY